MNKDANDNGIRALTISSAGHTLHHNGVFSKDGQWIVFDGRNDDTKIGETSEIGILNLLTGEEKIIYQTQNPSQYGPGVGAASFSPAEDRIIFIHGLPDASKEKPYDFTRRTGVAIDLEHPFKPVFMDARDVTYPYTPGSLRGGTHSHCWSADGKLISFTYNNELTEPGLRTVGVMLDAGSPVITDIAQGNNNGVMYAAVIADVVADPKPGSDEINKAFDECWAGERGYVNEKGERIPYAVAFQGNTKNEKGEIVTEIYVADIDTSLIVADKEAAGKAGERPRVPAGIRQRRISHTVKGLSPVRHWLRSSKDGALIYALAQDNNNITQLISCDINTGAVKFITNNPFSIDYPFNLNEAGDHVAFVGDNNVHLLDLKTGDVTSLTSYASSDPKIVGAASFLPDGNMLVFNQYRKSGEAQYLQVMSVQVHK